MLKILSEYSMNIFFPSVEKSIKLVLVACTILIYAGCATTTSEMAVITERPQQSSEGTPEEPPAIELAQVPNLPEVVPGQFDAGKMWTFDNPPVDYFRETYGVEVTTQWLDLASKAALRFGTGCSASFVSAHGLVMTNHHCARESITDVSRPGEALLDHGFYANGTEQERKVEDLYVDQLIQIEDVTERVQRNIPDYQNDEEEASARERSIESLEERMTSEVKAADSTHHVQIVSLYNGGLFSAYTFKRYEDVRLVMAPELMLGKFGGDADNFTYPRYSLDMAFFRVYDENGEPHQVEHFFKWSEEGVNEGDPVFVVGSPGSTSRLTTVSQLEYQRDHELPQQLEVLTSRMEILRAFIAEQPEEAEEFELRNQYYQLSNQVKSMQGQLEGLNDPLLMARKQAAEQLFQDAIDRDAGLGVRFGNLLTEIEAVQRSKEATARQSGALTYYGTSLGSRILTRALYGYAYTLFKQRGAPQETLTSLREDVREIEDFPAEVEKQYIVARIQEMQKYLGANDPSVKRMLQGNTPEVMAQILVDSTALMDSTRLEQIFDEGYLSSKDVTVPVINALAPLYFTLGQQTESFEAREENLSAELALARFEVYGTDLPPDATFSLRLSDGVVQGYAYNGTKAPPVTTFYGLYDHFQTYGKGSDWDLPERWIIPPENFDLSTPLNLVSTNDITGGNSGSPLLNSNLEVVGLIFDGNIESLPNEYLFRNETARAISVDVRGIQEVLDDIYDADRIVLELTQGTLAETEEEADTIIANGP